MHDLCGQLGNGKCAVVEIPRGQFDVEGFSNLVENLHRQQGMAAHLEEIVVDTDLVDSRTFPNISATTRSPGVRGAT